MSKFCVERLMWEIETKQVIVPHCDDFIDIIRKSNGEDECRERICSRFNLTSEQAEFLMCLSLDEMPNLYQEYLQKQLKYIVKLDRWLEDTATQCDKYARKNNTDYYVFQSPIPTMEVETLIIGINPGGYKEYTTALKEKGIQKRTKHDLSQEINLYSVRNYHPDNKVMAKKLSRVFISEDQMDILDTAIAINVYYFNTAKDSDLCGTIGIETMRFCESKTRELIEILNPQKIIFLTTAQWLLKNIGVTQIKSEGHFVKSGILKDRKILALPNPGYYKAYSYANGTEMSKILTEYMRD